MQRGTVDRQVADFARRPGGAPVQPPAQDGGQAEADAQPDQDEIVGACGGTVGPFGHRGQVHVVLDHHRLVPGVRERVERALVPGRQVHRQPGVAGARVDHAGTADHQRAEPGDLDPGAGAGLLDGAADQLDRVVGPVRVAAHLGHPAAGDVRHRGADQVEVDGQAGHVRAGRDDGIQRGVGAASPGLLPRDRHQATLLQPGQHLRHGDLGHAGVLADLGPGEHLAAEQEVERGPVVQHTQQARRTWPALWRGPSLCSPLVRLHRAAFL